MCKQNMKAQPEDDLMVRSTSLFGQPLELFPRNEFSRDVRQHNAERYAKGFTCWEQFVAMLFCQLAQAHSLREICGGLACSYGEETRADGSLIDDLVLTSFAASIVGRLPGPRGRSCGNLAM